MLGGNNTYTGGTTVSGGTLQLGNPLALGTGGLTANAGLVDLNALSLTTAGSNALPSVRSGRHDHQQRHDLEPRC